MCNRRAIHTMITLQTALTIATSNLYCKITLVWLDSSVSVLDDCTCDKIFLDDITMKNTFTDNKKENRKRHTFTLQVKHQR